MATVTLAAHVSGLGQFKRPLSGTPANVSAAKRLRLPTDPLPAPTPFPTTSSRPSRGTNITVPVARACFARMAPGTIVFVKTNRGPHYAGATASLGGLETVVSIDELNDMLSQDINHIRRNAPNSLFREVTTKSVFRYRETNNEKTQDTWTTTKVEVFDDTDSLIPYDHPLQQFVLDGVVCSRVDEVECSLTTVTPELVCNVAVMGMSPLVTQNTFDGFDCAPFNRPFVRRPPDHHYIRPVDVLSKLYVALVATRVSENTYRLRYDVVSQTNLEVAKWVSGSARLFSSNLVYRTDDLVVDKRIVLKAHTLGTVVDTNSGSKDFDQMTVNVRVAPYERVATSAGGFSLAVNAKQLFQPRPPTRTKNVTDARTTPPALAKRTTLPRHPLSGLRPLVVPTGSGGGPSSEQLQNILSAVTEGNRALRGQIENLKAEVLRERTVEHDARIYELEKQVEQKELEISRINLSRGLGQSDHDGLNDELQKANDNLKLEVANLKLEVAVLQARTLRRGGGVEEAARLQSRRAESAPGARQSVIQPQLDFLKKGMEEAGAGGENE